MIRSFAQFGTNSPIELSRRQIRANVAQVMYRPSSFGSDTYSYIVCGWFPVHSAEGHWMTGLILDVRTELSFEDLLTWPRQGACRIRCGAGCAGVACDVRVRPSRPPDSGDETRPF
ncbi:hypothetical protein EVAR_31309_1 [Eumeta japonica]|uniref:Uncharacterized protein n=1 Tax=Eumeta variegata TaxID=151549 RepID=A0A4C1VTN0_EUMVA|nr:hypothetical protein EVAR_31309_1 [Eumeta japonica]